MILMDAKEAGKLSEENRVFEDMQISSKARLVLDEIFDITKKQALHGKRDAKHLSISDESLARECVNVMRKLGYKGADHYKTMGPLTIIHPGGVVSALYGMHWSW